MDTLFFLISTICFTFGLLNLVLLAILKKSAGDAGTWTLLMPLGLLTAITVLEVVSYYLFYRYPGQPFRAITLLYEWARIAIAFSWTFIAYYHYHLNRVDRMHRGELRLLGGFSALLMLLVPAAVYGSTRLLGFIHGAVITLFVFAGIKGVLILRRKVRLLPSSRTAVTVAVISLVSYPAVAAGDFLGWRFPFLDPGMSFWVQAHPLYFFLVNIPMAVLVLHMLKHYYRPASKTSGELEKLSAELTEREREVLRLLYRGLRYQEIADTLFLSLATVKTHVHHIYQKLDITRREELFVQPAEQPPRPVPEGSPKGV